MDIKQKLIELPEQISKLESEILNNQELAEETAFNIRLWELSRIDEIASATDEGGKPKFSNDAKRQAELMRLKATSEVYITLDKDFKEYTHNVRAKEIELKRLYNIQNNLRAICRLESGEV